MREGRGRIEKMIEIVRTADGRSFVADHRTVAHGRPVDVARRLPGVALSPVVMFVISARRGIPLECELSDQRKGSERCGCSEQAAPGELGFSHD
jgi:hypothetical protein